MSTDNRAKVTDQNLAYLLLRLTLGVNMLIHGFIRIYGGQQNFVNAMTGMFEKTILPGWSVAVFATVLPWFEFALGVLLLLGLWSRAAYVAGAALMFVLTVGTTLRQDWAGAQLLMVYAIVFAGLLWLRAYNAFSLDARTKA